MIEIKIGTEFQNHVVIKEHYYDELSKDDIDHKCWLVQCMVCGHERTLPEEYIVRAMNGEVEVDACTNCKRIKFDRHRTMAANRIIPLEIVCEVFGRDILKEFEYVRLNNGLIARINCTIRDYFDYKHTERCVVFDESTKKEVVGMEVSIDYYGYGITLTPIYKQSGFGKDFARILYEKL